MMFELRDFGFTTAIGIGGDPVIGTTHIDALEAFENDPDTKAIVMIGEIGGDAEERAADYIKEHVTKPVVGYVAGFTAPEGKTMGHAGAIVSGSSGTAQAKKEALEAAGVKVGKTPSETAQLMREILARTTLRAALAVRMSAHASTRTSPRLCCGEHARRDGLGSAALLRSPRSGWRTPGRGAPRPPAPRPGASTAS